MYPSTKSKRGSQFSERARRIFSTHVSDFEHVTSKTSSSALDLLRYQNKKKTPRYSISYARNSSYSEDHIPISRIYVYDVTEEFRVKLWVFHPDKFLRLIKFPVIPTRYQLSTIIWIEYVDDNIYPEKARPKVKSLRQALTSEQFHRFRHLKSLV